MRVSCMLDGISPESIDPCLAVTDVTEKAPELSRTVLRHARGDGSLLAEEARLSLSVTVKLLVKERHPLRRALLLERLALWCRGTELKLSSRPGRRLLVRCEQPFSMGMKSWAEELAITFAARTVPYWEEDRERSLSLTDTAQWYIPGTAEGTPVSFTLRNTGEDTATCFTLKAGESTLKLDGLLLEPGEQVTGTVKDGFPSLILLHTDGSSENAAASVTDDSDDLLTVPCGAYSTVSLTGDQTMSAVLKARGRYL